MLSELPLQGLCEAQNAHLLRNDQAAIDSALRFYLSHEGIESVWTGANDIDVEGLFVWDDSGDPVIYTDWEGSNPNNYGNQDCVRFARSLSWDDADCDTEYSYACQLSLPGEQVIETTSTTTGEDTTTTGNLGLTTTSDDVTHTTASNDTDHTTESSDEEHTSTSNDVTFTSGLFSTFSGVDDTSHPIISTEPGLTSAVLHSTDATAQSGQWCTCTCNFTSLTRHQMQQILVQLRKENFVSKKNTSSYRRKLISVDDFRPSSVAMGTMGCVVLSLVLGTFVVLDVVDLYRVLSGLPALKHHLEIREKRLTF